MYDLPLEERIGHFVDVDLESKERIKNKLEGFTSFEEKLVYYNQQVCSLSAFGMEGSLIFEWGNNLDDVTRLYCGCSICRKRKEFDPKEEKVYFKLRAREVSRLQKLIGKAKTYQDKITALFATKGYSPEQSLQVYANVPFSGKARADWDLFDATPAIDLLPGSHEERIIFNDFVIAFFNKKFKEGDDFSSAYQGFDFKKERSRFEKTAGKAIDPTKLKDYLVGKIEEHFDYPNCIHAEDNANYIQKAIDENLASSGLVPNLFPKLALGLDIDFSQYRLNEYALLHYTYIEEIVKFYRYIKQWNKDILGITNISKNEAIDSTDTRIMKKSEDSESAESGGGREPLDLSFRDYQSQMLCPSKGIEEHGNHLLSLADFRTKIRYYNQHICSLAYNTSSSGLHCFGEYSYDDGVGTLFLARPIQMPTRSIKFIWRKDKKKLTGLKNYWQLNIPILTSCLVFSQKLLVSPGCRSLNLGFEKMAKIHFWPRVVVQSLNIF